MSEITRIAITGKMRSGKSTVASDLVSNYRFHRIAFGDALKRYADDIFAHSDVYRAEEITRPCPFGGVEIVGRRKPRKLYQDFGQIMRQLDPNVWVHHAEMAMHVWEGYRGVNGIVIDDLRQPNEYEWARENDFVIIRVSAYDKDRIHRAKLRGDDFDESMLSHETETHVDTFEVDYEIANDGDYDELERQMDEIMARLTSAQVTQASPYYSSMPSHEDEI